MTTNKQMYGVKLNENHTAKPEQVYNGFLGEGFINLYTKGEAIKKSKQFGGLVKPIGKKYAVDTLGILRLKKSDLSTNVKNLLHKYTDAVIIDNFDVYTNDVFEELLGILSENTKANGTILQSMLVSELNVLNTLCIDAAYVMIVD